MLRRSSAVFLALAGIGLSVGAFAPGVAASPAVGPGIAVAETVLAPSAAGDQAESAVAFDGVNFLVVWADQRPGVPSAIYGARVAPNGDLVDQAAFPISSGVANQTDPAVAFDGANYLVVWEDRRSGNSDIYGARISPDGTVHAPAGFLIGTGAQNEFSPAVAFDGINFVVLWEHWVDGSADIVAARVSPAGAVHAEIPVSSAPGTQRTPALAAGGNGVLAVWADGQPDDPGIWGTRLANDAGPVPTAASIAPGATQTPAVAFDGINFLVVWAEVTPRDVRGTRVDQAGAVIDSASFPVGTALGNQRDPRVAFDGTKYLVAWRDSASDDWDLFGTTVSTAGVAADTNGVGFATGTDADPDASLAFGGGTYLLAWTKDSALEFATDVSAIRIGTAGVAHGAVFIVSRSANDQADVAVAFDGANYLVVWTDDRSPSGSDIYAARVTAAGVPLDGTGIPVSTASGHQRRPDVAFDGTNFFVVWEDGRSSGVANVYGARVTSAGTVIDSAGIPISTAVLEQSDPAVAFDGTNYLVAWSDMRSSVTWDIYAARVAPSGTVMNPSGLAVSTAPGPQVAPDVVAGANELLVTWADDRTNFFQDVYGARVTKAGVVLDTAGIPISTAVGDQMRPQGAFDGTSYLVAWEDRRSLTVLDIYAARVSTAGSVIDPGGIQVAIAGEEAIGPSVAYDGATHIVAWSELEPSGSELRATRVHPTGSVLDPGGFVVATGNAREADLMLLGRPSGTTAAVYRRNDGTGRAVIREIVRAPLPTAPVIDTGPSGVVGTTLATFTFSTTEGGRTFECKLDSGAFADCASPRGYGPLGDGAHSFEVRAKDADGVTGPSIVRTWTVDTVPPPAPTIHSGPSGATASSSASFTFASTEGGAQYECRLDDGAFEGCFSPRGFAGLAEGQHTFAVRARDAVGNLSATTSRVWTVDTVAPPAPAIESAPSGLVRSRAATIAFSGEEPGVDFECRLDGAPFASCTSPAAYVLLAQGPHTFSVRARDGAGSVSAVTTRTWTVDTVAPQTRIVKKPKAKTRLRTATFGFKSSEAGPKFQCKLDKKPWAACKTPRTYKQLKPGRHVFQVRAIDKAGNRDGSPAKVAWKINR